MAVTLGIGSKSATSYLNQDIIDKLKAEDRKVTVKPLETKLEKWEDQSAAFEAIKTQFSALETTLKGFEQGSSSNVFESISYSSLGDSVMYDVTGTLDEGKYDISVTQLATKDVYKSDLINEADLNTAIATDDDGEGDDDDNITIAHGGTDYKFAINGKSYNELVEEINDTSSNPFTASLEEVEDGKFRLIIKSKDTGAENNLTVSETNDNTALNLAHVDNTGTNFKGTVDGIDYDLSSNTVELSDSLSFTAIKTGDSSISIQNDPNAALTQISNFVEQYNNLSDAIKTATTYDSDNDKAGVLQGSGELRNMLDNLTNKLFDNYGEAGKEKNIFNIGIELNEYGKLTIDTNALSKAIADDRESIEAMFVGTPDNKGLGHLMYEYTDSLDDLTDGLMTLFENNLNGLKTSYEEDKTEATEKLDYKYEQMSLQFASFTTLITNMEASFQSLKLTIDQSVAQK